MTPSPRRRRHTTVTAALAAARRHDLERVADGILLCRCGEWFPSPDTFNAHRSDELAADLTTYKPRRPTVDQTLLEQVAQAYLDAEPGSRSAAVGDLLGVSPHSAGTYIARARKTGALHAENCRRAAIHLNHAARAE